MERERHRETRGGAGRQPGPAAPAPAPALSGEGSAEPRQTGRFGRGSCSPRGRPKDQRGELEVYAPLLPPAGPGRRHRGAPGPRRTPPLPTSAGGPGVPASSARQPVGAPSTPARSQPFQPPAVRRSGPLAQLPGRPRLNRLLRARRLLPGPFRPVSDCRASVTASLAAASGRAALDTGARGQLCPPALTFRGRFGHSEASHFYTF